MPDSAHADSPVIDNYNICEVLITQQSKLCNYNQICSNAYLMFAVHYG